MKKNFNKNEDLFKEVVNEAAAELANDFDIAPEEIEFSARHKEKMEELFLAARRKERILKLSKISKIAACIVAAIVISGVAVFSGVTAWKRISVEYHFEPENPGTSIEFSDGEPTKYFDEFLSLKYIPARFVCTDKKSDENIEFVRFEGEVGEWFEFCAYVTGAPEKNADESVNQYIWSNGKYEISLMGNLEMKELEKIAEKANVYR